MRWTTDEMLGRSPVIPVITLHDAKAAVPLVQALVRGGISIAEITLRTPAGLEAIRRVAAELPEVLVGAGTVLSPRDLDAAVSANAAFAVSPGGTRELLAAGRDRPIPLLPGVLTATEIMTGLDHGYEAFKFFPADASGGQAALRALGSPFPRVRFCPSGGMKLENVRAYLSLPNVACVAGIWMLPEAAVKSGDWNQIEALTRQTVEIVRQAGAA